MTITNQEISVIRKMLARTREKTDPLVVASNNPEAHPKAKELIAAQNVLRDCITVVVNDCMPIDELFCAELALRLASYAVSIVAVERQEAVAKVVANSFEKMHHDRMKKGIGVQSEWMTDGVRHPNMPTKGSTN